MNNERFADDMEHAMGGAMQNDLACRAVGGAAFGRACLAAAWSLQIALYCSPSDAEIVPPRGTVDSRVRATAYDVDQVYRLHGFVGYEIDVQFEPGESFTGLGAGDIEGLSYFGQDNHLFLKPKAPKVATNLTVLTNRRPYQFEYTAVSQRSSGEDADVIFALRFTYPAVASQEAREEAARRVDSELEHASSRRRQNIDYWFCGDKALRPVLASDDGIHTRLRFAANAELPAIFMRNEDETESLLNYSMDNGDVIVHRIARRFIIRRGTLSGCIVNKGYAGSGTSLESGTIAPQVERRVQGGMP
ncbi:MAG: TrbG/VirB9 family P-type conjugative transfer protein [Pseudomonadota bacterium]|nr:TrbG/VirB9 family P-type conjugative transfer protein [Pseudomonadota bacterium]